MIATVENANINLSNFFSTEELNSFINFSSYHFNGWDLSTLMHQVDHGVMVTVRVEFIDCPDMAHDAEAAALMAAKALVARSWGWAVNDVEPIRTTVDGRESFSWYLFPSWF